MLWVMDIAEDGPDGEWLTSFLFWDIPSTAFCTDIGAAIAPAVDQLQASALLPERHRRRCAATLRERLSTDGCRRRSTSTSAHARSQVCRVR